MFFENIHFMKCLFAPYMGSCVQPSGLIALPQIWGYVYSLQWRVPFKEKRKDRKALLLVYLSN